MSRLKLDYVILFLLCVLLFAFPPSMFRDLTLFQDGERLDLAKSDFSEARTYTVEFTWQKRFWQGSVVQVWVDDCLRSIVVNGSDLSTEFAYCDFVGSRRIDLAPYLTNGQATLELEIENLGGPGGLTVTGTGNVFFRTLRYLLAFLLILIWLYRRGRADDGLGGAVELEADVSQAEGGERATPWVPVRGKLAALRSYRGVLVVALVLMAGGYFLWFRAVPPKATSSVADGAADWEPAAGEQSEAKVAIPALSTGVGAPSWADDSRLNPRLLMAGGEFLMGSPESVAYGDEQPQRRVRVSRFWIQQHEVTNEEYRRFKPEHAFTRGQERHPVVNLTWHQALAYAEWLGGSLPTEAQWEFAARGTRGRKYPWGDDEPSCARANFNDCGWRLKAVGGHPEGATPEGLLDLAGNAWEWCGDWYADRYPAGLETDPRGPAAGSVRVFRGGSFIGGPGHLRGAYRGNYHPGFLGHDIGLRVAWSAAGGPG